MVKRASPSRRSELSLEQAGALLPSLYGLLKQTEPSADEYDVAWSGPYYLVKKRRWHPTRFLLYNGVLHGMLFLPNRLVRMEGDLRCGVVRWVDDAGHVQRSSEWVFALSDVFERLKAAVANPEAYNRRVQRYLPLECRIGRIERRLTWPSDYRPMSPERLAAFETVIDGARSHTGLAALSAKEYVRIAAIGYDAAFSQARAMEPVEKHRRYADGRHGGMFDLSVDDAEAFQQWFTSRKWQGAHPFEIVYGYPHGIVLWPDLQEGRWRFRFWVQDERYHLSALEMIEAFDKAGLPVDFVGAEGTLRRLAGSDEVRIGPHPGQLSLEQLREDRPDAISHIRWDPLPRIHPVTPRGEARIAWVEAHGTPAGFTDSGTTDR